MSRWIVELVLPAGTFACRPVVTSQSPAELDLDAHASMAELLSWKRATPSCAGAPCFPIVPVPEVPLSSRRFLMAHCADALSAKQMADDLRTLLPRPLPPWSETMRTIFRNCAPEPRS
jgi:hypothetical protein